jgi:hypothetical protein
MPLLSDCLLVGVIMIDRRLSTQCVQQLAGLDTTFSQENAEAVRDAAEFPHAVMMLFAGYLARRFADAEHRDRLIIEQDNLVASVLAALEHYLRGGDADVRTVIMDSFIEQIYDENLWLFDYLLGKTGPLLRHEMLSHKIQRRGATP